MMVSLKDIHKEYIKSNPYISEKEFKLICYSFNKKLSERLIREGYKYNMPGRLGELSVAKNKMKYEKLYFDYSLWNKEGIKSYHLNEHSDNYYAFVRWNKKKSVIKNKHFYGFRFTRTNNREMSKVMQSKNGHQLYEIANRKDAV